MKKIVALLLAVVTFFLVAATLLREPAAHKRYKEYLKEYEVLKAGYLYEAQALSPQNALEQERGLAERQRLHHNFKEDHKALRVKYGLPSEKPEGEDGAWMAGRVPGE